MKKENCSCGLLACEQVNKKGNDHQFILQPLPYLENELEPYISAQTVRYHYGKHLPAYLDNTTGLKRGTSFETLSLQDIVRKSTGSLFNNAAQVLNHYFYFETLSSPLKEFELPAKVDKLIQANFENWIHFKEKFTEAALSVFGSGWVWLLQEGEKLEIWPSSNADTPLVHNKYPILTLDVWEHAYYLDTQNSRAKYVENFWQVGNWEVIEKRVRLQ